MEISKNKDGQDPTKNPDGTDADANMGGENSPPQKTEAEVKADLIDELGLDEEKDEVLIDDLVNKEMRQQKAFGKLVFQKRGWRKKAQDKEDGKKGDKQTKAKSKKEKPEGFTRADAEEMFAQRELDSLEVSDSLSKEIKTYAKLQKVSIKKAFNSEYIQFLKEKEDKSGKNKKASLKKGGGNQAGTDDDDAKEMGEFDMTKKSGRIGWAKYKRKHGMA